MVLLRCLFIRLALLGLLVWPEVPAQVCTNAVAENLFREAEFLPADESTLYPEKTVTDLLSRQPAEIQESIISSQNETNAKLSKDLGLASNYVCPFCIYELPRKLWFFYNNNQTMKCFSLQPLYLTRCTMYFCRVFNVYNWCYQCVLEWLYRYFWAVCVEQSGNWSIRYLNKRLPTYCSCRRYNIYPLGTCQVRRNVLTDPNKG